jgi:hypothetical protein
MVERGFCLIQGPPGTGKTHTVVQLINVLHMRQYQNYFNAFSEQNFSARPIPSSLFNPNSELATVIDVDEPIHATQSLFNDVTKNSSQYLRVVPKRPRILGKQIIL